jgi:glycosyltransferase involved in cell wall biosynthesis
VADIRDPWSWHPHGYWSSARHQRLEQEVLSGHSHVVTVTEGFRRKYLELYPELAGRIHLIRNGYEDADVGVPQPAFTPIKIHYLGSLTAGNLEDVRKRTLFLFLKALRMLGDAKLPGADGIRVKVAGHNVAATQKLVDQFDLNHQVSILGNLPHTEARKLREEADILLLVDMLYENRESTFIALKVYEYLAANRPILALLPEGSEAGEIILQKKRGVVCRVDDVESICAGLRRMLSGNFDYDPNSDISEFSCRNTTRQLAEVLAESASNRPRTDSAA